MTMEFFMKKRMLKTTLLYLLGFLLLLAFRLFYGYATFNTSSADTGTYIYGTNNEVNMSSGQLKLNKASAKRIYQKETGTVVQNVSIEQKFEKAATIRSETDQFDKALSKVDSQIKKFNAIIQYEQKTGLKGQRAMELTIGVEPEKFDNMTEAVRKIGRLKAININKTDKTSEYKNLQANRKSLEETMNSLTALKSRSGKIDEYINLENQILEIKKQIQGLGIQLGEYDAENELCTIIFSLKETSFTSYSFVRSLKISLEWTARIYFSITFSLFMFLGGAALFLYILNKLNIIQVIKKLFEKINK
jgi:uncharacterized protein YfcZ (UPF0381/DUF406 family)